MPLPDAERMLSYEGEMMREGRDGEAKVLSLLQSFSTVLHIDDVRDVPAWRARDVDFLVSKRNGEALRVEAKSDRYIASTGNFCFELARVHHKAGEFFRAGWSVFSEATHVFVWCAEAGYMYEMSMDNVRAGFRQMVRSSKQMQVSTVQTDRERTTLNVLVPLRYIEHARYTHAFGHWILKKD